jgi:16S rRNA (adenine1518-N6/adenine1519-N6)-dimethyltransferase
MARPGHSDYGLLSLLLQLQFEPREFFKIPPGCFFPEPDVDSACLRLVRRPDRALTSEGQALFVRLVKRGFSQRRKMMLKLLKSEWPEASLHGAFEELGLSPQIRAEKVSREEFVALAGILLKTNP